MDARSDGVPRQSARTSDFFIAKAGDFPHEKYVSVEVCQGGERRVNGEIDVLRRGTRAFVCQHGWLGLPQTLAVVIEREVPRDLKQPGPDLAVRGLGDRGPAHPQEDILC
ncbi:MAG: hypothetical protein AUH43_26335 [Acidobacteria bacterium 13_1_40CM_65_14]|nr:MAG: hypothetical protein AUH43_26335 [Acidobacteria bacterium 13_1_40CM_65_14]OLD19417.1 MAG: hypothetical protein AUJ01_05985 [Acidobacteria bacterium 13_1_40CM_3_65_5]